MGLLDVPLSVTCYLGRIGISIFVSYNNDLPLNLFSREYDVYSEFYS